MIPEQYLEKVYSGFLGMNVGIRLGAPVEPSIWTYERIRDTYGDIRGYVKPYKMFGADDDVNGPVYFLRALRDDAVRRRVKPQDVAKAWLNYTREGIGMFWWGGYGISTEHTAYLNLKNGVPAPRSGSAEQNGKILAEQIGGQIFIDTWGLVHPGNKRAAADDAQAAASVSHDGEGLNGARFIAACIAEAFVNHDILDIMDRALEELPENCLYGAVVRAVLDFHKTESEDWRSCREMLEREWGYDKYPGVCHIIPNAGVCALAMAYGMGDFSRTVEIAVMCSWDTDCNAGNAGTVLGVMNGIEGIPGHYREPVNDGLILSGISGYLNILDIPTFAKETALYGYRMSKMRPPAELAQGYKEGEIYFDFELPGATHNMRVSDPFFCRISHTRERAYRGSGSLKILADRMVRGNRCKLFYKPFYRRDEFSDERYSPVLTPTVYPGQTVSMKIYGDQWNGWEMLGVAPYIRTMDDKVEHLQGYVQIQQGKWLELEYVIPDTQGSLIDEVGIVLEGYAPSKSKTYGVFYLDEFSVRGSSSYTIAIGKQRKEFGTVTPFSVDHGAWEIEGGRLSLICCGEACAFAGNYYGKDTSVSVEMTPANGLSHLLLVRAQGAMRWYGAGFSGKDRVEIIKNDFGRQVLAGKRFLWKQGETYGLKLEALGEELVLTINGREILRARDGSFAYGMYGCGSAGMGRTYFGDFRIQQN